MTQGLDELSGSRPHVTWQQQPLTPFGVCLTLSAPGRLEDLPRTLLEESVLDHGLVLVRGARQMTEHELVLYASTWGELLTWNFGVVLNLVVHAEPKNYLFTHGNVPLHWDGAFAAVVPRFQLFQCLQAPAPGTGGETLFSHTPRALELASEEQRERWQRVSISYRTEKVAHYGGLTTARLAQQHPITGAPTLRFAEELNDESVHLNPLSLEIRGLPSEDHAGLLLELRRALYDPRVCYAHAWRTGDLLLADNHALLHGRTAFHVGSPRHLQRVHII